MSEQPEPDSEACVRPFAPWVWGPLIFSYACLGLFPGTTFFFNDVHDGTFGLIAYGYTLGVVYFLIQGVGRLFQRLWARALCAFGRIFLLGISLLPVMVVTLFILLDKSSKPDHFSDNLSIPDNIEIAEVLPEPPCLEGEETPSPRTHPPVGQPVGKDGPAISLASALSNCTGKFIVTCRINGGEPGIAYLRAYEVTQGTRLSKPSLEKETLFRLPWSKNAKEVFTGEVECTIREGDSGKPYAARFEVWFQPNSGSPERKLAQRVFKIEGHQWRGM